jgi:hypothetical protein
MQLNKMERALMCLLRDYPGQLSGPQSFVDKLVEQGVPSKIAGRSSASRARAQKTPSDWFYLDGDEAMIAQPRGDHVPIFGRYTRRVHK